VPNLASALLDAQRGGAAPPSPDGTPGINLQGFLVGNAWTDPAIDNEGRVSAFPHNLRTDVE
jgi:serine carboxypeptidase-like clade II